MVERRVPDREGNGQENGTRGLIQSKYIRYMHKTVKVNKIDFKIQFNNYINENVVPQTCLPLDNLTNLTAWS